MTYNDQATAGENLKTLAAKKTGIVAACLYLNNSVFVSYHAPGREEFPLPAHPGPEGWQFAGGHLAGFQPVWLNGERIGTVYLCSDLKEFT